MKETTALLFALTLMAGCISIPIVHTKTPTAADMDKLGCLAAKGRLAAIDELAMTAEALYQDIDYEKDHARVANNLVLMRAAFTPIGTLAGKGSQTALDALQYANGNPRLRSFTPDAFGIAAGMGNTEALDVLLNYKEHGFLLSSTVFALRPAAEKNIPEAVNFLVEVMNDPRHKALWRGASKGLVGAAALGNQAAQEALENYSRAE